MIDFISLVILFVGLSVASYYDLKTTEIPDKFAYAFLLLSISLFITFSYMNNFKDFKQLLLVSIGISSIGFLMYFFGQWGMGDAFLLASCSFAFFRSYKEVLLFYPQLDFFTNLIIIGAFYIPLYMFPSFIKSKIAKKEFLKQIKENSLKTIVLISSLLISYVLISFYLLGIIPIKSVIFSLLFSFSIIVLWFYLKACEKILIKKIPVEKLKIGDVLLESKRWDGIDMKTIEKIKKSGKKYVYIKNGVAFAPAFLISLLVTIFLGNLYTFVLKLFLLLL